MKVLHLALEVVRIQVIPRLPKGTRVNTFEIADSGPYPDKGNFEYVGTYVNGERVYGYVDITYLDCCA